ncbi:type I-F CRISPR-associated endoribonuclease Cas6/Csy4 [Endozoicomonas euniceicola]|uniref:Type I-F CRISPR-associated endoribonuclease Cas6/Csy4 n=1 Tax=Endozoicomonas euniceicola TaxID=1234143 RepID=A0ABY6GU37_9GAMM|nr:type I-F CRISPR-associated endoribonuclease Cas6/Csy4 [Endozoicomonas euniceicola]UYM16287.1 type I-F CRISPR-associated endoribonuclease Cas6/Csy4 [Endozoicomonas euniceicola]
MTKKPRYYIELHLPEDKDIQAISCSHVISYLHSCNKRNNWNIGIDFPLENKEGLGALIRLFSYEKETLNIFLKSKMLEKLKAINAISGKSNFVTLVPESTEEILLFRNNKIEKRQLSYWMKKRYSESEAIEIIEKLPPVDTHAHLVKLYSSKSNRPMKRYLHRVEAKSRSDGKFNSYGYSSKDKHVTVPFF